MHENQLHDILTSIIHELSNRTSVRIDKPICRDGNKWCWDRWGWIQMLAGVGVDGFKLHRDGWGCD